MSDVVAREKALTETGPVSWKMYLRIEGVRQGLEMVVAVVLVFRRVVLQAGHDLHVVSLGLAIRLEM